MSEVNIDAGLVEGGGSDLSRTEEKLVEMSNGCICCTLREDLMIEVERLANEKRFDYLLIESTGISEPIPVAQTFSFTDEESGIDLSENERRAAWERFGKSENECHAAWERFSPRLVPQNVSPENAPNHLF